jgi:hypothetical protein
MINQQQAIKRFERKCRAEFRTWNEAASYLDVSPLQLRRIRSGMCPFNDRVLEYMGFEPVLMYKVKS